MMDTPVLTDTKLALMTIIICVMAQIRTLKIKPEHILYILGISWHDNILLYLYTVQQCNLSSLRMENDNRENGGCSWS